MSSENSTARITRRSIADALDTYDDQITAVNNAKLNDLKAYRDQLSGQGYTPAGIKAEIEACKAAIRKRRAAAKDPQAVDSRDALVDEIYEEISPPRHAPRTHARMRPHPSPPATPVRVKAWMKVPIRTRSRRGTYPDLRTVVGVRAETWRGRSMSPSRCRSTSRFPKAALGSLTGQSSAGKFLVCSRKRIH